MESYTINNNMEVMEYLDMGTPKDIELEENGLKFTNQETCKFYANLSKLFFRSKLWPDGEFKIVMGKTQLEIEKVNMTLPLDICFESPNQALEFTHKNQDLVDEINNYIATHQ